MRSVFYVTYKFCARLSVFEKMDKVQFELHIKCGLYWTDYKQKEIWQTTFSVDSTTAMTRPHNY